MGDAKSLSVTIDAGDAKLAGDVLLPSGRAGLVIFVHGSGSSRFSTRNRRVAQILNAGGFGTLLADLLTPEEEAFDARTSSLRFDIPMLADRTTRLIDFACSHDALSHLRIGLFGASTGAAAAIIAAAQREHAVHAVVSRGGRVDLAGPALEALHAPLMMVVGERDLPVIALHEDVLPRIRAPFKYEIIAGASHLFEEPGALDEVASIALSWLRSSLNTSKGTLNDVSS